MLCEVFEPVDEDRAVFKACDDCLVAEREAEEVNPGWGTHTQ